MKTLEKEFDEFTKKTIICFKEGDNRVLSYAEDFSLNEIKQFIKKKLSELAKEMIEEKGIKWMQEGNRKDRKGYTEGFNDKRQCCIDIAKKYKLI